MELSLDYYPLLHRGLVRERNEDRCGAFEPEEAALRAQRGHLFIVADGMGGLTAGDVAAETAVRGVQEAYFRDAWRGPAEQLRAAFAAANARIVALAEHRGHESMGAAVVAAAVVQDEVWMAHVGDCRGYLVRAGAISRLTTDHSWVQEHVDAGHLSPAEVQAHPYRNVLTRALGVDTEATPDVCSARLAPGDALLLCSDGLWSLADDTELAAAITAAAHAFGAAQALADLALARGGHDNIALIVVRIAVTESETATRPTGVAPTLRIEREPATGAQG